MIKRSQQGYLSLLAVLLIVVVGFLGVAMTQMFFGGTRATADYAQAANAFYLAESGIEHATHQLLTSILPYRTACSGLSINNTLGEGAYATTSTGPFFDSSPATVSGALSASATTIPVNSTAGYQSAGRIMIDSELINYGGISGNNFIGATRAMDGTLATTHASGTRVGQYQCNLSSQGGVPSLTAPSVPNGPFGKRILQDNIQLQDGWAVGNSSSGNFRLFRWNSPTELDWSNGSVASGSAANLFKVFMLSYVDGWAVGASARFLRWNGSSWTLTTVTPNVQYNGLFCSASNDCHAVGNASGNQVILDWDGSSWTRDTPSGSVGGIALQSVHCNTSNNCWAVGNRSGGTKIFYQWNGSNWNGISVSAALTNNASFPFFSVFCNSITDCWAVGSNNIFARKNGANWSAYSTGLPSTAYNSITCINASDCWAVGNVNSSRDLIVHWDGSSWSRDASNPTPTVNLRGLSCTSTKDCWAVGSTSSGGIIHWDGTSWTTFATSLPSGITLQNVGIISPTSNPHAAWQETYP